MIGALTLVTSLKPAQLGKSFTLTTDGLKKETAGQMIEGTHETLTFTDAASLAGILASVRTDQAIMSSLPRDGRSSGQIVTRRALAQHPGALARSKDDFGFPTGQPGVMTLDYDPEADSVSRDALFNTLLRVVPTLNDAGAVWWCSGSSFIYAGETVVQGLRGQRIYLLISDVGDTERAGAVLAQRLWLAGHGRVVVSKSGQTLLRSTFDTAMQQPARLDFIGGAICKTGLRQDRGSPIVMGGAGWLDTRIAIPDLSPVETAAYEDKVTAAKREAAPEVERVQTAWKAERSRSMVQSLVAGGSRPIDAEERSSRVVDAALAGTLMGDFQLTLADGRRVTVEDVLDDRAKYHRETTKDPLEPDYQGGKTCGILYLCLV